MRYKRVCLSMLAVAVAVRGISATGADALAQRRLHEAFRSGEFAALTASLLTGEPVQNRAPPRVWVLHKLPRQAAEPEKETYPPFTADEAPPVAGRCTYAVDAASLLLSPTPVTVAETGPTVLIVHTHTSEAYTQTAGWTYAETDPLRTDDPTQSVVRVGERIAEVLREKGIETLHDTALHDYPDYNGAYARTLKSTEAILEENPSVQIVLDVHRDADTDAGTVQTERGAAARIMFVVGTDEGGLSHDGWRENLTLALKWQAAVERRAKGLCKPIDLRRERFNQHVRPGALLVEIGATGNTLPEALAAAEVLADALGDLLER
ncbi:MAG: stage II sporulation protein P [Oscillospiraceae bacterium]|nr:stage II sporulation protein P [Oscillospiraceae bacterium]